ncbi:hypothetical protein J2X31_001310 [Flavobacterium arsenatis]|uniref:Uncharacterized protein n=1 Tax=Flavobacterium arsenatis TaxID=1484332 RepID=A0ABU1TMV8_9FLAO|nr:hypothetical protein [Flavobacterium arsenatis]MDR6967303.1 hypothetical protein [Flavobacterium arsenatis]
MFDTKTNHLYHSNSNDQRYKKSYLKKSKKETKNWKCIDEIATV